jgi:soluble lytic murein transglycosylase
MYKFFLILFAIFSVILLNNQKVYAFTNLLNKNNYPYLNYSNEIYFKQAYNDYIHGDWKNAAGLFWLYSDKGKALIKYSFYYEGVCLFNLKEYHKANYVFLKLVDWGTDFPFYKNAVFYLALCQGKLGYLNSEISILHYIAAHSHKYSIKAYASYNMYKAYLKLNNYNMADIYLLKLYLDYPDFCQKHNLHINSSNLTAYQKLKRGINLYYDSYYHQSISLLKEIPGKNKKANLIILKDLMKLNSPNFLKDVNQALVYGDGIDCYQDYGTTRQAFLNLKMYYYYYILHNLSKTWAILNKNAEKYEYLNSRELNIYRILMWYHVSNDLKHGNLVNAEKNLKLFLSMANNNNVNSSNAKFFFWYGVVLKNLGLKNKAYFYFIKIKNSNSIRYSYYYAMANVMIKKMMPPVKETEKNISVDYSNINFNKNMLIFKETLKTDWPLNLDFMALKAILNLKLYSLSNMAIKQFINIVNTKFSDNSGDITGLNTSEKIISGLAYMLYKDGKYADAISLINNYNHSSLLLNKQFLTILYPRPYYIYVKKYADSYGIPVNLVYAIMRQESLYNPSSVSYDDAMGLMQIMPATAYYIAYQIGYYNFYPEMLYEKNINIDFGTYYLSTLLSQFAGKKYLAIAAYNAGPGSVSYWKNYMLKNDDRPLFIEQIPFNQTRNYVKQVLTNYYIYNYIYN